MTGIRHGVTAEDLHALAATDRASLFRDADTLIDSDQGIIRVPFRVVEDALAGRSRLTLCRLLYSRTWFIEDGILTGKAPRTIDGSSLDDRLADIARELNAREPVISTETWGPGPDFRRAKGLTPVTATGAHAPARLNILHLRNHALKAIAARRLGVSPGICLLDITRDDSAVVIHVNSGGNVCAVEQRLNGHGYRAKALPFDPDVYGGKVRVTLREPAPPGD